MNILIFNWRDIKNPKSGGAEIATMEYAKGWVKKGHSVTWFTSGFENSKKKENIAGINIIRNGNFITVFLHAFIFYLLSGQKFDLVIDEIHGLPFFTPLYVKKPKISFIHEIADEIWDYMYPFPINKIGKIIEPLLFIPYRNIKFITVSVSTKKSLEKVGINNKNVFVINNGSTNKAVTKLPIKEVTPTFIFVSRVVKMKGIEEVVRAFFYILREIKDARLWIVGDGDKKYVNQLKETMRSYSIETKVKFFGRVEDKTKLVLMKKAHILLHASVKEGWGLVIIEAASQGTPAVVYNVSGLRDSVKNGKTGVVLGNNTANEMATQATKLYKDRKRYKVYQKNSLIWANSLTWEKATKESLTLIKFVIKNG